MSTFKLTEEHIRAACDFGSLRKGLEYYRNGYVLRSSPSQMNKTQIEISSEVKGSYQSSYTQDILLTLFNHSVRIDGECSCPVGYNCKHVIAVCLYFSHNQGDLSLEDDGLDLKTQRWIGNFSELSATKKSGTTEDFFIYRLFDSRYQGGEISFYRAKTLKNGKMSRGREVRNENFIYNQRDSDTTTVEDLEIMKLLPALEGDYYGRDIKFIGELGYIVLRKILATSRCFYRDNDDFLEFGEDKKELLYDWKKGTKKTKLTSNLQMGEHLLFTDPMLCVNSLTNRVYEIVSKYRTDEIKLFEEAPEIENKSLDSFVSKILSGRSDVNIPLPPVKNSKKITEKPTPLLRIYPDKTIALQFVYEDMEINYYPKQAELHSVVDSKIISLTRDLTLEESFKDRISGFGFGDKEFQNVLVFTSLEKSKQSYIQKWKEFLEEKIPLLEADNWIVEFTENFEMKFEKAESIVVDTTESETNDWFNLSFDIEIGGKKQPLLPLISSLLNEFDNAEELPEFLNIELSLNHFVEVNSSDIKPILNTIFELFDKQEGDEIKINPYDAHLLDSFEDSSVVWKGSRELLALSKKLKNFKEISKVMPPKKLKAALRDYQRDGVDWLNFLYEFRFGGILADDMGLGKTLQTLTHLLRLKEDKKLNKPSLIIMPTSLLGNWKNEARTFTPTLKIMEHYGIDRSDNFSKFRDFDIIITTYQLAQRDEEKLKKMSFLYIILDEAQKIKNPKTKMAKAIKTFKSEYRLALTGTPIENHLGELWSIFDFLMGGFFDTLTFFKEYYQNPIEKENSISMQNLLNKKVKPFMLRRTKDEVLEDLPEKQEIIKYARFDSKQSALYESIRVTMEAKVRDSVSAKGLGRSHITILDALLKLRQVCCDPSLLKLSQAKNVEESAKLDLFLELVDELLAEKRKILVFSQFTAMLKIIEAKLTQNRIKYEKLTGSTTKRDQVIDRFKNGDVDIFLISLKAGGVGLNLVEADSVIHYDPWWNPAVENQATDRAHRIGQEKAVFVYKLIVENSIEQKILELQKKKKTLQDGLYRDKDGKKEEDKFTGSDLMELLRV